MKVVCIKECSYSFNLTIGKLYEQQKDGFEFFPVSSIDYYYLEGDNGICKYYSKECFIDVQKIRNDKLNELGI